ncbi:MAG: MiaB/RimO family radical SAM methylthiotransferase [Elusimicrobiales bacterium]
MKIYLKTFGCRVNQAETQSLRERISAAGHEICRRFEEADAAVINGCAVTAGADKDCARLLRLIARRNPGCRIIATGCYASVSPQSVLENAPRAEIIPNHRKQDIPSEFFGAEKAPGFGWRASSHHGRSRAFVKIQDGCSGGCKYCIVPLARPHVSSKPVEEALSEIAALAENGYGEIVLSGINIGCYRCPHTGARLENLLGGIWRAGGDFRVRLSSIEPRDVSDGLVAAALAGGDRFCGHFHIPLQSGADTALRAMGRNYDCAFYLSVLEKIKKAWPAAGIYSDVIAGYPQESAADFSAGHEFISEAGFAGLHVFRYSPRPGTAAAALKPLDPRTTFARAEKLRALDKQLRRAFAAALVGSTQLVTVETCKNGAACGITGSFVNVALDGNPGSPLARVKILSASEGRCRGVVI